MDEPPVIVQARPGKSVFVVWLLLAGLVAFVFTGLVGYFLFFQARPRSSNPVTGRLARTLAPSKFSFLDIPESTVPGRYKWTDGPSEFFMVLYDDHTFMNRDGTTFPQYRWDIGADGLSIRWLSSSSRFTNLEAAGVYTCVTAKGIARMEKLPPYNPSQLVPPKAIASIRLSGRCETDGLTPVNTGGDGEIFPGSVAGVECYQIMRKDNRPAGYLYLQIAPELKEPPFTNALVIVEYFDAVPQDGGRRGLTVQYDAQHGVYANVQPLNLDGSDTWQEATFYLPRPNFQNLQNSAADFRVCAGSPELFVRSVKLVKNTILPETKMPTSAAVR